MFIKRFLVLVAGVLLFIFFFIGYFTYARVGIENHFAQDRRDYGVDGAILITNDNGQPAPPQRQVTQPAATNTAPSPSSASGTPTGTNDASNPAPAADTSNPPAPAMNAPDASPATNTVPPAAAPTDTNAAPDSNAAPMTPAPSTYYSPDESNSPFQPAGYHPGGSPFFAQALKTEPSPTAVSVQAPATNATPNPAEPPSEMAPATPPTTETNAPTGTPLRAAPVQASVIILGYHQFMAKGKTSKNQYMMAQDVFESEMKYLRDNGYKVVPLSDVVRFLKGEIGLPPNSVAITIDDGFKSAVVYAAPVLKKYGYPWTFFVYPAFITTAEGPGAASWNDLLELQKDGVDIESHSMTHPFPGLSHKMQPLLATLPDHPMSEEEMTKFLEAEAKSLSPKTPKHLLTPEEYAAFLKNETAGAKEILEKKLGKTVPYIAYPYGDYNKQVEEAALAAGYEGIFTVAGNPVHASTTKLSSVGRYIITKPVEGAFAAYLRQGALGIADASPPVGGTTSDPRPVISAVIGYAGNLDPKSLQAQVRDIGYVKFDYDPKTSTLRLYLPRDLVRPVVIIDVHVKDANTGQNLVASWRFNYEPLGKTEATHAPISAETNTAPAHPAGTTNSSPAAKVPAPDSKPAASASKKSE